MTGKTAEMPAGLYLFNPEDPEAVRVFQKQGESCFFSRSSIDGIKRLYRVRDFPSHWWLSFSEGEDHYSGKTRLRPAFLA